MAAAAVCPEGNEVTSTSESESAGRGRAIRTLIAAVTVSETAIATARVIALRNRRAIRRAVMSTTVTPITMPTPPMRSNAWATRIPASVRQPRWRSCHQESSGDGPLPELRMTIPSASTPAMPSRPSSPRLRMEVARVGDGGISVVRSIPSHWPPDIRAIPVSAVSA